MKAAIGVIDSGVGGLTVVKELMTQLPTEPIIYIGDDARCPYGPRPADEVIQYTLEMATALAKMEIKMLVVACNTATAVALDTLKNTFDFPIVGVIEPGARAAIRQSSSKQIAVLGTVGTINSKAYEQAILSAVPDATVHPLACPPFVPIVESGQYKSPSASLIVQETLRPLLQKTFDTTILGCTHYPLLYDHIQSHLPDGVSIVSSAVETVEDVKRVLAANQLHNDCQEVPTPSFFTTGSPTEFRMIINDWLSLKQPNVHKIQL